MSGKKRLDRGERKEEPEVPVVGGASLEDVFRRLKELLDINLGDPIVGKSFPRKRGRGGGLRFIGKVGPKFGREEKSRE